MKKYTNYKLQIEENIFYLNEEAIDVFASTRLEIIKYDKTKRFYINDKFRMGYYTYLTYMEKYEEIY